MKDVITLHCGIENCNTHYEYKYNKNIVEAISAQWRNEKSKGGDWAGLLPEQPTIGKYYELHINFALKIDLSQRFWVTYFEPYTEHEGLESEIGISTMLFCLCQKKSVKNIGKHIAEIEVEVIDIKKITENNYINIEINKRTEIIDSQINSSYVTVENFENFSSISANYQSDCGWTYIIYKKDGNYNIVAENHWDFHRNIWMLSNEEINFNQAKKYGI